LDVVPLASAETMAADVEPADHRLERDQKRGSVLAAITELPRTSREVPVLFYVRDCSQQDIATLLGLSVSTVNNRLHAARTKLKKGMVTTMQVTLHAT